MNYDKTSGPNGRYAAQFRKDAKTDNNNGQNIVSHTSLLEPGRESRGTRKVADMYEKYPVEECPKCAHVNRDCDC